MITKKVLPVLIALALLLSLFICGIGIYISKLEKTNKQHNNEIIAEKEAIKLELKQLSENYDSVKVTNSELQEALELKKAETDSLYNAIDKTAPKLSLLRVYRTQISKLKKEKIQLLKANDSLITVNVLMKDSLNLKDTEIAEYFKVREMLYNENLELNVKMNKRKQLSFYSTNGIGAKIKKSGKVTISDKIKKLEQLKICTSVKSNNQLISESKRVYFKVFNPNKKLIGKLIKVKNRSKTVTYSISHKFFYQNQRVNICKFIKAEPADIVPGEYTIEVYMDHELQDISRFSLR